MSLSPTPQISTQIEKRHEEKYGIPNITITGAFLLIAQQFSSRCLTFIANQILLRYLSPKILGISAQLELYSITVLFFSREGLRIALQRQVDSSDINHCPLPKPMEEETKNRNRPLDICTPAGKIQATINLAYISLALGIILSIILAWIYLDSLHSRDSAIAEIPHLKLSVILCAIASITELLAEPCYIVVQQKSRHFIRAASESTAAVSRCLTTCLSVITASQLRFEIGVLSFALGQLAYSISLLAVYYYNVAQISQQEGFLILPNYIYTSNTKSKDYIFSCFSRPLLSLSSSFLVQSLFKYALTQGDIFIISLLASPDTQGVYSLVNNYGGLIARLILQPIEEVSRNHFGKLVSVYGKSSHKVTSKVYQSLIQVIHSYLIISVFIISIGPTMAPILLRIVAGPKWSETEAGNVLAIYCYYLPLLAVNGITEAFVSSVATESEVHRQTAWMMLFSATFSGAAFLFLKVYQYGAQGLVLANALNMILRIVWAITFIQSFARHCRDKINFGTLIPRPITLAAGVAVSAILLKTKMADSDLVSACKVCALGIGLLAFMYVTPIPDSTLR